MTCPVINFQFLFTHYRPINPAFILPNIISDAKTQFYSISNSAQMIKYAETINYSAVIYFLEESIISVGKLRIFMVRPVQCTEMGFLWLPHGF